MVSFPSLLVYSSLALLFVRLAVGATFVVHSLPKLKKPEGMAQGMKWPKWAVQLLGLVELLGALYVATGFWYQAGAAMLAAVMVGAIYYKKFVWKAPFASPEKMGWEYDLVLLACCLLIATSALGGYAF